MENQTYFEITSDTGSLINLATCAICTRLYGSEKHIGKVKFCCGHLRVGRRDTATEKKKEKRKKNTPIRRSKFCSRSEARSSSKLDAMIGSSASSRKYNKK